MLRDAMLDTARRLVDARRVVKYQQEIGVLAVLWYHALTTGAGAQTLGEEYCDIYQVNARGEFPGAVRQWSLAMLEALTPPLLQRAKLRAQRIATRRELEAEEGRRGQGQVLGSVNNIAATTSAETRDDASGSDGACDDDEDDDAYIVIEDGGGEGDPSNRRRRRRRGRPPWLDFGRLREVFSRGVAHAARAVDNATLAAFAPSSDPDVPEPTDPTRGFFPRLHLATFYLWVS